MKSETSAAGLRSELARHDLQIYRLAPIVGMHPARLGQVLRGKVPLTPGLTGRILAAIRGDEPRSA